MKSINNLQFTWTPKDGTHGLVVSSMCATVPKRLVSTMCTTTFIKHHKRHFKLLFQKISVSSMRATIEHHKRHFKVLFQKRLVSSMCATTFIEHHKRYFKLLFQNFVSGIDSRQCMSNLFRYFSELVLITCFQEVFSELCFRFIQNLFHIFVSALLFGNPRRCH